MSEVLALVPTSKDAKVSLLDELTRLLLLAQENKLTQLAYVAVVDGSFDIGRTNVSKLEGISYAAMMQQTFIDQMRTE